MKPIAKGRPLKEAATLRRLAAQLVAVAERLEAQFPACPMCWSRFEPTNPEQLYCSAKCRVEAKRRRYEVNKASRGDDRTAPGTPATLQRDAG